MKEGTKGGKGTKSRRERAQKGEKEQQIWLQPVISIETIQTQKTWMSPNPMERLFRRRGRAGCG